MRLLVICRAGLAMLGAAAGVSGSAAGTEATAGTKTEVNGLARSSTTGPRA